jgi:6-pyruvoyltetrahydropterin/6-carboxytetrahydropterin synthase|nr:MAG TPA: 6-pyruvoyl tetrahydropterin synthase [Caudoviricetes sp.]
MNKLTATRYHDFSYGHRVVGHEGKCRNLHGHNGRVTFYISAPTTDSVGRVIDFSVIKSILCEWLERNWDHRFLVWEKDPLKDALISLDKTVVVVPFNPTAENLASYLLEEVGPKFLPKEVVLERVSFEETRKCSATVSLPSYFCKC